MSAGLACTRDARPHALAWLRGLLNEYHGSGRSEAYYDLLAGDWLDICLHLTYVAWERARAAEPPPERRPVPVIGTMDAFIDASCEVVFEDQWFSEVRALLAGASPDSWPFARQDVEIAIGRRAWAKDAMTRWVGSSRPSVLLCRPYVGCGRSEWMTTLWRWRRWARWDDLDYPLRAGAPVDERWRRAQSAAVSPAGDFLALVRAMMPLHLPVALLEAFGAIRNQALALRLPRPRVVYSAGSFQGHLTFKLLAAEWKDEGTKVLAHQHGGGYGLDRIHVLEEYETRVADRFYTWGWSSSEASVKPMSVPPRAQHRGNPRQILLVSCGYPASVFRLNYQPSRGTVETVVDNTVGFLSGMPRDQSLLIRLTAAYEGLTPRPRFAAAAPWASFDDGRTSIFQRYADSRLVVHNYLGTSWLETLATNIPTVCFFDPQTYVFREAAQPLVDGLERVGILHRSGPAAACFVERLGATVESWWRTSDVQSARQAFVEKYANFSSEWAHQWQREFEALA